MTDSDYKLAWRMLKGAVEAVMYQDGQTEEKFKTMEKFIKMMDKVEETIEEMDRCF